MNKSIVRPIFMSIIISTMICGLGVIDILSVAAAENGSVKLDVNKSIADNLVALKGNIVTVYLASGQTITGTVIDVNGNLLHLSKLNQKDFFDGLIAIDRISAIDTRVRGQ